MKISASIYSNKLKSIDVLVEELDAHSIDSFHIDSIDDLSVFDDIARIRQLSTTPIDLHVISSRPEKYYDRIIDHDIEYVTFQYENLTTELKLPDSMRAKSGLAITSNTPLEAFEPYKDRFSFILLMTTEPGKSGGTFDKRNFRRIRKFKNLYPNRKIHVDGGVNDEVSFILRDLGVYKVVSGSYLVNNSRMGAAMLNLKHHEVHSHFQIRDFMIEKDDLPVLPFHDVTFSDILRTIEKFNHGVALFTDEEGRFKGLSTNADVRRGLLKHINDLNQTSAQEVINRNPVIIHEDRTTSDMLKLIGNLNFPVLFLPVINRDGYLTGAVTFNQLIKGTS